MKEILSSAVSSFRFIEQSAAACFKARLHDSVGDSRSVNYAKCPLIKINIMYY